MIWIGFEPLALVCVVKLPFQANVHPRASGTPGCLGVPLLVGIRITFGGTPGCIGKLSGQPLRRAS